MAKGRKTGGRRTGSVNKLTAEVKAAAQRYTKDCLITLAAIMKHGESEQARIAAARELLDRGHGKAPQALTDADGGSLHIPGSIAFLIQKAPDADCRD